MEQNESYYVEKVKEIHIEFEDNEVCILRNIRDCDVNLNRIETCYITIKSDVFYPLIKKEYEMRNTVKKITFIFKGVWTKDITESFDNLIYEYNANALIDDFKMHFSDLDCGTIQFKLIGNFYA